MAPSPRIGDYVVIIRVVRQDGTIEHLSDDFAAMTDAIAFCHNSRMYAVGKSPVETVHAIVLCRAEGFPIKQITEVKRNF